MTLVLKRKMENLNNDLNCGCDGMLIKKHKPCNIVTKERKTKISQIVKSLMNHIFSIPFLKISKIPGNDENQKYFEDVLQRIEENKYHHLDQVFDDVEEVLSKKLMNENQVDIGTQKLNYSQEDIEVMANEMRKKIHRIQENIFGQENTLQEPKEKKDMKDIQHRQDLDKTFQTLQLRYPAVPAVTLMTKALDISLSKSLDWNCIQKELEEVNKMHQPKYKSYRFYPSREQEFEKENVIHSYIAGYQFHKMITKSSNAPVPLRTIMNTSDAIESITYIENHELSAAYKNQKNVFQQQGKVNENGNVDELLLFHGTAVSSLDSILATNFIVDALPQQQNTNNEQRKKTMMFGRGVYFSELPAISLMYGNGLLLCKVMPGNCEIFKPQGVPPPDISLEYDSREVQANDSQGVIHVVKSPAQILPYCVIQLKKQSLTSQYIKPSHPSPSVPCSRPNLPISNRADHASWSVVKVDQSKEPMDNKAPLKTIEKTLLNFSTPTTPSDDNPTCSICCDPLSSAGAVALSSCGHKFHSSCIQEVISHQTGHQHIQCPNCQAIQGIKTGNQPTEGQMYFRKHAGQAPGYPDCGMIVIKYTMVDGVQADCHPNPGKPFHAKGFPRTAFLPDNQQGNHVLELLVKAFRRRLVFTVGSSLSRGEDDCVTWNGIHHKTQIQDNGNGHGYPDLGYLERVQGELKQKGVE